MLMGAAFRGCQQSVYDDNSLSSATVFYGSAESKMVCKIGALELTESLMSLDWAISCWIPLRYGCGKVKRAAFNWRVLVLFRPLKRLSNFRIHAIWHPLLLDSYRAIVHTSFVFTKKWMGLLVDPFVMGLILKKTENSTRKWRHDSMLNKV